MSNEQESLEDQIYFFAWTCFVTILKVIGFLAFKMLSIMFVTNIRTWYLEKFHEREKRLENALDQDEVPSNNLSTRKKNINLKNWRFLDEKCQNEVEKSEESFVLNANQFLDRIKLRKDERDKQLQKVKSNLQESLNEINAKKTS